MRQPDVDTRGGKRRRQVRRWWFAATGAVAAILFVALIAAQAADDASGCGSVDPTDPANYSEIAIKNDTGQTVTVDDCHGAECQLGLLPARLRPGTTFADHAACGASGSDMTSWRVRSEGGGLLGYIAVDTPRKTDGVVFRVSKASHDRTTPTRAG